MEMDENKVNGESTGDTIMLKNLLSRLRKTTGSFIEASKRAAEEIAGKKSEDNDMEEKETLTQETRVINLQEAVPNAENGSDIKTESDNEVEKEAPVKEEDEIINEIESEEVAVDLEDITKEIEDAVNKAVNLGNQEILNALSGSDSASVTKSISGVNSALDAVKVRLQAIQMATEDGMRDNGNVISSLRKDISDLREKLNEVSQTINSVSKLSDSVFDLKNAQLNMKKSIDSMETAIRRLKKRMGVSTAILSIIGVIIVALQIISLLS